MPGRGRGLTGDSWQLRGEAGANTRSATGLTEYLNCAPVWQSE